MSLTVISKQNLLEPAAQEMTLHNHFLLEVIDKKSGKVVKTAEAENVVTNYMRTRLAANYPPVNLMGNCAVGSGVNAPAPTDTKLGLERARAPQATVPSMVPSYTTFFVDHVNQIYWNRAKYQFSETVANFALTEVGLCESSSYEQALGGNSGNTPDGTTRGLAIDYYYSLMYTRALFKDANGSPISVTKTSNQLITITATVYLTRGGADQNTVLLDPWVERTIRGLSNYYGAVALGDGSGTLNRNRTTLQGGSLSFKGRDAYGKGLASVNAWFWDNDLQVWTQTRPVNKPYTTTYYVDWQFNEGNVTFTELMWYAGYWYNSGTSVPPVAQDYYAPGSNSGAPMAYMVLPVGNVAGSSYTKNDQIKLRQYFELIWS